MNANDRFEIIGELYRADTGYLRPGKDDALRDSSSDENRARFDQWFATQAFTSAIARIASIQDVRIEYNELLYGVARKHPNETRHQTALRYIRQAEAPVYGDAQCGKLDTENGHSKS